MENSRRKNVYLSLSGKGYRNGLPMTQMTEGAVVRCYKVPMGANYLWVDNRHRQEMVWAKASEYSEVMQPPRAYFTKPYTHACDAQLYDEYYWDNETQQWRTDNEFLDVDWDDEDDDAWNPPRCLKCGREMELDCDGSCDWEEEEDDDEDFYDDDDDVCQYCGRKACPLGDDCDGFYEAEDWYDEDEWDEDEDYQCYYCENPDCNGECFFDEEIDEEENERECAETREHCKC